MATRYAIYERTSQGEKLGNEVMAYSLQQAKELVIKWYRGQSVKIATYRSSCEDECGIQITHTNGRVESYSRKK